MFSSISYLTFIIHKILCFIAIDKLYMYHKCEFQTIQYFKKSIDRERIEVSFLCLAIPSRNKIFYWKSNEIVSYVCTISWNFRRLNEHVNRGRMGTGVKYSASVRAMKNNLRFINEQRLFDLFVKYDRNNVVSVFFRFLINVNLKKWHRKWCLYLSY